MSSRIEEADGVRAPGARAREMVVNDDARLAESVRRLLADEGYDTRVACDGLAAIDALREWPAEVVVWT